MPASPLAPELIWGLIPRFVGLLYVIAFGSLIPQLSSLLGSKGLLSMEDRLRCIRRDFPGPRRFVEYPSIFWLSSSDLMIKLVPWVGVLCGLCLIYGGPISPWALGLACVLWISFEPATVIFPWDTMLQEVGFLSLFLPTTLPLPLLETSEMPTPTVAFMFRWLVLRLMLGFGRVKFVGTHKTDALYLRGFFVWMPVPTPLAWFGHQLPALVLKGMLVFMFVAEVIAPLLGLFTGVPRLVSFGLLTALMVGIQSTGNWGFFNIGYVFVCFCLLDVNASIFDWGDPAWAGTFWQWPNVAVNALMLVMFLTSLLYVVVVDSWITRAFAHWNFDSMIWNRAWARGLLRYLRAVAPLRIINGYGVFPPHSSAPMRVVPVFEGTRDGGKTWQAYRYKFMPTRATDRAPFVAPYHPRVDMASYYSIPGGFDASFYGAFIGDGTPYGTWTRSSWLDRLAQALLRGEPTAEGIFGTNPFADAPPDQVRVSAQAMIPTTPAERRATGKWWHVRRLGSFVPARGREEWIDKYALPEPEVFHPDWVNYKRRTPQLRALVKAYQDGMEPDQAVLLNSDFTAEEVARFWSEFVPALAERRGDFSCHEERATALRLQFGMEAIIRFERILERFAWLLRSRTERYQYADATPKISLPLDSAFRFHLLLQEMVTDGREAYLALLAHPEKAAARAEQSTDETQLWTLTMIRYDLMMAHVSAFRWLDIAEEPYRMKVPGLFEYYPLMLTIVPPGEEYWPKQERQPDGEHVVAGLYPQSERLAAGGGQLGGVAAE